MHFRKLNGDRTVRGGATFALALILALAAASGLVAQAPAGYYDTVDTTDATSLRQTLHEVIDDNVKIPYTDTTTDVWDVVNLADEDPNNSNNIIDLYMNASYPKIPGGIGDYNREHSWPKSYGFPNDGPDNYPYTDCHHLFAADAGYNSSRSNKPFRNCNAGCSENPTLLNDGRGGGSGVYPGNSNWTAGSFTQGTWETWSGRKGDVARAIFYMDIRYEGGTHGVTGIAEPDLIVTDNEALIDASNTGSNEAVAYMGMLSVLLQWHQEDPVDSREIWRNEVVYGLQGNRNPFIDHPEWAQCLHLGVCTFDGVPPAAPQSLIATALNGGADLSWVANGEPDLSGYHVYRSTAAGGPYTRVNSAQVATNTYTDSGLTNGTTYFYVVTAVDTSNNESGDSNEASVTPDGTLPDSTPPAAPTGLAASAGDGQIGLTWSANGEPDLDGYNVYRSTTSGGPYSQVNGALVTAASFNDGGLTNGTTYFYVVTAVDTSANESAASSESSAIPTAPGGGGGTVILSEVLYDVASGDDGFEWVELYNAGATAVDLSGWSLGNGGTDYTYSVVQLGGVIQPGATFVVGGPTSDATNANPSFDQAVDFSPDFQNGGTAGDGVALFNVPAASVTASTVPVDAVVYGPNNDSGLIDETGGANAPEVGDASPGSSLERVDLAGNWQIQSSPTPSTTSLAPANTPPAVAIATPADGSTFQVGQSIGFAGTASDVEDGDLTPGLSWTSDLDGAIGAGGSFSASLSVGTHTITASVTDSGALGGSDVVTVTVTVNPISASSDVILSEVLDDPTSTDDGLEWVELYNRGAAPVDLSGWSLGNGGTDYTYSLVQLAGVIQPGETFVVGGPTSSAANYDPVFDGLVDFNPDFQNGGTAGDGVALFDIPAISVTPSTVPVDAVVYGPNNDSGLIDETGVANPPEVGDAPSASSIERLDEAGTWAIQPAPTPNATPLAPVANTAPSVTITAPATGSTFNDGELITFMGTATDAEDGDLTTGLSWVSSLDGTIGGGGAFSTSLSLGTHTITASVTDSGGLGGSDQISVAVEVVGGGISLDAVGYKVKGRQRVDLIWSGATSSNVDVFRDGSLLTVTANDGFHTDNIGVKGGGTYVYEVCEAGTGFCSDPVQVVF